VRPLLASLLITLAALAEDAPNLARVDPPAAKVSVKEAIEGAVRFLVANQNRDGSFGKETSGRAWEITCQVPGGHQAFKSATTSLCWLGLQAVKFQPEESRKAQERALRWLLKGARVKRATGRQLYNVWSHAYGLKALAQALKTKAKGASAEDLRAAAKEMVSVIERYQTPDGGWGYYDFRVKAAKPSWSTSFTTATTLVALREAEAAGIVLPPHVPDKAVTNILRCRKPDGTYIYGLYARYWPHGRIAKPQGSSLRTQSCNLALLLSGKSSEKELREGILQLVDNHRFAIAGVRRPIPHESWYAVSGYFYLYGQMYAACVLDHLTDADKRLFMPKVVRYVLKTRQTDGSFWDYPCYGYHKFYGTGYALMTLAHAE
jgi:hypothetical protein